MDPTAALIVFGEKARALLAPTVTVCTPELDDEVVDAGAAAAAAGVELVLEFAGGPYWANASGRKATRRELLEKCMLSLLGRVSS